MSTSVLDIAASITEALQAPSDYWTYADPLSGRHVQTRSQPRALVVFLCETDGRLCEASSDVLRRYVGHFITPERAASLASELCEGRIAIGGVDFPIPNADLR